jgi:hypothetical protein
MFGPHFYYGHTRRLITVFGTLFNNMRIVKRDNSGKILKTILVPISYGPRQLFLARINDERYMNNSKIAIRLPRMSFELTGLSFDPSKKLQKGMLGDLHLRNENAHETGVRERILYAVPYRLSIQLSIYSNFIDDSLQITEQILPFFQPDYTVSIRQIENNFSTDIPFVLQSVSMSDEYEGDFGSTRRTITNVLDFEARINFFGPIRKDKIILHSNVTLKDTDMSKEGNPYETNDFIIENGEVEKYFDTMIAPRYIIRVEAIEFFSVGHRIRSVNSLYEAEVINVNTETNEITLGFADGKFNANDNLFNINNSMSFNSLSFTEDWNTLTNEKNNI